MFLLPRAVAARASPVHGVGLTPRSATVSEHKSMPEMPQQMETNKGESNKVCGPRPLPELPLIFSFISALQQPPVGSVVPIAHTRRLRLRLVKPPALRES